MARNIKVCAAGAPVPEGIGRSVHTPEEGIRAVREYYSDLLRNWVWTESPDLLILQECCDRFWTPRGKEDLFAFYERRGDEIRDFFAEEARKNACYIAYSAVRKIDGIWRNATEILDRRGKRAGIYFKNYITDGEYENGVRPGTELPLIECDFGTLACITCYDLNFEKLRSRCRKLKPDIIAFSSMFHGQLLQKIWAYECGAYFAGAIADLPEILDPQGESIRHSCYKYDKVISAKINLDREIVHLDHHAEKLRQAKAKYKDAIGIKYPDFLGSVLLTAESPDLTVREVMEEFGMISRDEYLHNSAERAKLNGVPDPD